MTGPSATRTGPNGPAVGPGSASPAVFRSGRSRTGGAAGRRIGVARSTSATEPSVGRAPEAKQAAPCLALMPRPAPSQCVQSVAADRASNRQRNNPAARASGQMAHQRRRNQRRRCSGRPCCAPHRCPWLRRAPRRTRRLPERASIRRASCASATSTQSSRRRATRFRQRPRAGAYAANWGADYPSRGGGIPVSVRRRDSRLVKDN